MARPIHREVWVDLTGKTDTMVIIGHVQHAMRRVAVSEDDIYEFRREAVKAPNLAGVLAVCRKWVEVTNE